MTDYKESSLWDLAYNLDPTNTDLCATIDEPLAEKLVDLDRLHEIYYYLCYGKMHTLLPHTKKKINELLIQEINNKETTQWHQFRNFITWLNEDIKTKISERWLDNDKIDLDDSWMAESAPKDTDTSLKVLAKLVRVYKKKKSNKNVKIMENVFLNFDTSRINEACEILSKSTPAVVAMLLKRTDIDNKYTIKGLRALSKLSKQRDLDIKIDFDMLKHLGPKGRLDAMKQLMGMFDFYYQYKQKIINAGREFNDRYFKDKLKTYTLPFKEIPKRDDIEAFLFPCCMKYNDEVVAMVKRFDELINEKEK